MSTAPPRPELSERNRPVIAVGLLLAVVLGLRWPIASHDVEHYVGPDEGEVVENVLEMMKTGDLDHRHPGYPGLHFYLQMAPLEAHLLLSRWEGRGEAIPDLPRSGFYLAARRTTLLAGVLAALVVYFAGLRFLAARDALVGASLLALSPLTFRESAVVSPDLMLALFVSLVLLSALTLVDPDAGVSPRSALVRFLLAGAAVGLATAIKYTGALTVFAYGTAWACRSRPGERLRELRFGLAGLAAAGLTFVLVSPYTFLHLGRSLRGLGMHVGYYRASDNNAALELLRVLATRGLGPLALLLALFGAVRAVTERDRPLLVLLAYPAAYLTLFAGFERAFPRHALPLLPPLALLAAAAVSGIGRRWRRRGGTGVLYGAIVAGMLAPLFGGSVELFVRSLRPTPAERAARWARASLPPGSRVLEDQYTPRLSRNFRVHRLRVEERVFVGNFDWVFYSGYPPGIDVSGLREVTRFETAGALGDTVFLYQVPPRESLMGVTIDEDRRSVEIGAGELPYFGQGWDPPEPGAFGTRRLSRGDFSEIFVTRPEARDPDRLFCTMHLGTAVPGTTIEIAVELNDERVETFTVAREEGEALEAELPARSWKRGLNRIVLRYGETTRRDRRHREAAIWFSRLRLSRN